MTPEKNLEKLGIILPVGSAPAANYANAVQSRGMLYIAGKAPVPVEGALPKGRLGQEFSSDEGYAFARSACIELIAVIKNELKSLDSVERVVEVQGFLNATTDFEDHANVMNGASDLLVEVFGDKGVHARSVLGASSLRGGLPVILKVIVEVRD